MNRDHHLVELVNPAGLGTGQSTVEDAHRSPGQLHRAFSVLLQDRFGRLLLQRRAAAKSRFPLRWANACCGHPAPGIPVVAAATARLAEELGISGVQLTPVGVYLYRADDPDTGLVEHEYDHVLVGQVDADVALRPDPDEVAELRWIPVDEVTAGSDAYAPWLSGVVAVLVGTPYHQEVFDVDAPASHAGSGLAD
jgi:isopentenyl-diphosphate delta-isomerase